MTVYVGQGAVSIMIYNFVFLGIMVILYLSGMIGGMFRMGGIAEALRNATEEVSGIFKTNGKVAADKLVHLNDIFNHTYLDGKMLKIWKSSVSNDSLDLKPGSVMADKDNIYVGTGEGTLKIEELQLEGKKRMGAVDFLKGKQVDGSVLG